MIEHLLVQDKHCYSQERTRIQLALFLLLLSDTAPRPGAVLRSECYRDTNDALMYKVEVQNKIPSAIQC